MRCVDNKKNGTIVGSLRIVKGAICPGADQCLVKSFNVLCNLLVVGNVHLFVFTIFSKLMTDCNRNISSN